MNLLLLPVTLERALFPSHLAVSDIALSQSPLQYLSTLLLYYYNYVRDTQQSVRKIVVLKLRLRISRHFKIFIECLPKKYVSSDFQIT